MKIERIGTEYIVAEDIFPREDNQTSEFFFFKDEESAKKFYNTKKSEVMKEIGSTEFFKGFETNDIVDQEISNLFVLISDSKQRLFYSLRYIHNID